MTQEEYRERFIDSLNKSLEDQDLKGEMREQFFKTALYFYDIGVSDCNKSRRIEWENVSLIAMVGIIVAALIIKLFV